MLRLKLDSRKLRRKLAGIASRIKHLRPVAADFGDHLIRGWIKSMPVQTQPSEPGGPPAIHHRDLARSLTRNVLEAGAAVEAGTPFPSGGVLHFGTQKYLGGPIRPREKKALTIPLTDAARGKRAGDFGKLQFRPSRRGGKKNIIGVLGLGKGPEFEPLFALATEVTIAPRPWAIVAEEDETYLFKAMTDHLLKELARG